MNVITRPYIDSMSGFINNTSQGSPFKSASDIQSKKNQEPATVKTGDQFSSIHETNKDSEANRPDGIKTNETNTYSKIISEQDQALSQAEIKLLEDLQRIDTKIRQHEMAHIAAGGRYITSGINFTYKRGPDGKNYAVGGEVGIDASPIPGDPEATIKKMNQVKSAALAPADPSPQDLKVASNATSEASKALSELMISQVKNQTMANEKKAFNNLKKAAVCYKSIGSMPDKDTSSFKIVV